MKIDKALQLIDVCSEKIGAILCFTLIALMGVQVLEVICRYVFNKPTIWALEINSQIFAGVGMMAGAYALLHETHVRIDILYRGWSSQRKALVDMLSYSIVFLLLCLLLWKGSEMAWWSFKIKETGYSYFAPLLWPVKTALPLAALLMLFQTFNKIVRSCRSLSIPKHGIRR